jgi:hypothetical protein
MPTNCDAIANPNPVPPKVLVVEVSTCAKASKDSLLLFRRNANARISNTKVQRDFVGGFKKPLELDPHFAPLRKLNGIADQID